MPMRNDAGVRGIARTYLVQASSDWARGPCGSRFAAKRAAATHRAPTSPATHSGVRRAALARRDRDVLEIVALALEAETSRR